VTFSELGLAPEIARAVLEKGYEAPTPIQAGTIPGVLSGKDLIVYNLEFRTRPVELFACQLGGAAFFDAGDAADGFDQFHMRQSAGFGFRVLFPQLDRIVFRGDIGFPLGDRTDPNFSPPGRFAPFTIAVAFEQAFSVPGVGGRVGTTTGAGYLGQ